MPFSEILSKEKYQAEIERELEATKSSMQSRLNQLNAMQFSYDEGSSGYTSDPYGIENPSDSEGYGSESGEGSAG